MRYIRMVLLLLLYYHGVHTCTNSLLTTIYVSVEFFASCKRRVSRVTLRDVLSLLIFIV